MRLSLEDGCSYVGFHLLQVLKDSRTVQISVLYLTKFIEKMFGKVIGVELLQLGPHGYLQSFLIRKWSYVAVVDDPLLRLHGAHSHR